MLLPALSLLFALLLPNAPPPSYPVPHATAGNTLTMSKSIALSPIKYANVRDKKPRFKAKPTTTHDIPQYDGPDSFPNQKEYANVRSPVPRFSDKKKKR